MTVRRLQPNRLRLSTKVGIVAVVSLLLTTVVTTMLQLRLFKGNLEETLRREQQTLVNSIAQDLDRQLITLKNALVGSAQAVTEADVLSSESAQKYLDTSAGLNAIFERSVFLFSPAGHLIAERPYLPNRRGQDFSWRNYNRDTIRLRGPVISEPFITTKGDHAIVVMVAAPVFSRKNGDIIAINAGSLGLSKPQLLGNIANMTIGKSGFIYIVTREGALVMHPDRSRLLSRPYALNANPIFERALSGFEGSGRSVENNGRPAISTFKRIPSTQWIIAAVYPEDDAFEHFAALARNLIVILVFASLIACALVWFSIRGLVLNIQLKNEILKRLRRESAYRLRTKTQFFNEASHDFRQRLHGMQLLVNTAERNLFQQISPSREALDVQPEDAPLQLLRRVKVAVADLQRYLINLLEIARLETIAVHAEADAVELQVLLQHLALQFEAVAEDQNVQLKLRFTTLTIVSDTKMLLRILENLVSNAIKFSRGKVLVAARARQDSLIVDVIDNGVGISGEDCMRIFGAFVQGQSVQRYRQCDEDKSAGGSDFMSSRQCDSLGVIGGGSCLASGYFGIGLGLSTVRRLADLLRIRIVVRSKVGYGTVISLRIPWSVS